jgi:hypothetical protein
MIKETFTEPIQPVINWPVNHIIKHNGSHCTIIEHRDDSITVIKDHVSGYLEIDSKTLIDPMYSEERIFKLSKKELVKIERLSYLFLKITDDLHGGLTSQQATEYEELKLQLMTVLPIG